MTRQEFYEKYSSPRCLGNDLHMRFNGIVTSIHWTRPQEHPRIFLFRPQFDAIVAYRQEFYRDWERVMVAIKYETPEQQAVPTEFDEYFRKNIWELMA